MADKSPFRKRAAAAVHSTMAKTGRSSGMTRATVWAVCIALSQPTGSLSAQAAVIPVAPDTVRARDTLPNHPIVNECNTAKPEWIFCDDFETDRLSHYFEYSHPDSSFERTDSVGVLGSWAMRVHFKKGQVDAGSLKLAFGKTPSPYLRAIDSGTTIYREIYWRVFLRNDSTWTGGGGDKLSRAQVLASSAWSQAMGAPVWSAGGTPPGSNYLAIDPYSGSDSAGRLTTNTYNDFPHLRWLGAARGATPIFDQAHVGRWYCIEAHIRLNDAGQSNGMFELWIDDWLEARRIDLNWVGRFADYGLNTVFFENYWNSGSPVAQDRYLDNVIVSTRRVGCGRLIAP